MFYCFFEGGPFKRWLSFFVLRDWSKREIWFQKKQLHILLLKFQLYFSHAFTFDCSNFNFLSLTYFSCTHTHTNICWIHTLTLTLSKSWIETGCLIKYSNHLNIRHLNSRKVWKSILFCVWNSDHKHGQNGGHFVLTISILVRYSNGI